MPPPEPICTCCNGTGQHEYKPRITASPDDIDTECSYCSGTGKTWFNSKRRERCPNYEQLLRSIQR